MHPFFDFFRQRAWLAGLLLLVATVWAAPADEKIDYNSYYRYPLSLGVESQYLIPLSSYTPLGVTAPYSVFEVSANVRWPLPPLPMLQPTIRLGAMFFDRSDVSIPDTMDHTDVYVSAGLTGSWRFSKLLEVGAELLGGYDYSMYSNIVQGSTLGNGSLILDAGLKLTISPFFNLNIELHPSLRYLYSFGSISGFNGPVFAIGALANVRLGADPDAGGGSIKAIQFEQLAVPVAFAAMQSWYVTHPLGSVVVKNVEKEALKDLEISFYQAGYMDSPTHTSTIAQLAPGESKKVDLLAAYNQEVFNTVGITPLNGEVAAAYRYQGKAAEQRQAVTYDLHDKSAIVWDDDRKAAAFITQTDPVVRNLASYVRQSCKDQVIKDISPSLQTAMQVFGALGVMGCLYQADPSAPFAKMQESKMTVDSVSLARYTLGHLTGDCDDLTVLFCSLMESAGVEAAFLTVPGHIYAAINTEAKTANFRQVHPDRAMTIALKDELWVPVEITLIGKSGFMEAWRTGIEEWAAWEKDPTVRGFYTVADAQQLYRAVALKEAAAIFTNPDARQVVASFKEAQAKLAETLLAPYIEQANAKDATSNDFSKLGVRYAQYGNYPKAEAAFRQALKLDQKNLNATVNLGNLYYLQKDYPRALSSYTSGLQLVGQSPQAAEYAKLLINVSKVYYQVEKWAEAKDYFAKAQTASAEVAKQFSYLSSQGEAGARASDAIELQGQILFLGE
jgi:tetratricopeptide (TPR) repeat protein